MVRLERELEAAVLDADILASREPAHGYHRLQVGLAEAQSPTTTTTNEPGTYRRREPFVAGLAAGAVSGVAAER